jgi:hypothetical protein
VPQGSTGPAECAQAGNRVRFASRLLKTFRLGIKLAKPNYQFAKRQRDLAKKQKKEQKKLKKALPGEPGEPGTEGEADTAESGPVVVTEIKAPE